MFAETGNEVTSQYECTLHLGNGLKIGACTLAFVVAVTAAIFLHLA